ncbi:MAG: hypothetical protein MUP66_00655 [Candidatus Nanohaloarchaeota archaeon QJJ-5]|nr:hypothetical protein [Candidatus Nanohaloarchaeota archaeon QJJ-5]
MNYTPDAWNDMRTYLEQERPETRLDGTLPSRVTSADVKLAYDQENDAIVPFIVGDVNANPEGIAGLHDRWYDGALDSAADAFLGNTDDPDEVAVSLPAAVYDGDAPSWLQKGKEALYEAVDERVETTYKLRDGAPLEVNEEGELEVEGQSLDGYVNLNDTGEGLDNALGGDITAMSNGANAPSAAWNAYRPSTNKVGLLQAAADLDDYTEVMFPGFTTVDTVDELAAYHEDTAKDVIFKVPNGTHGDQVVAIESDQDVYDRLREEVERVRDKGNRSDSFALTDADGRFITRDGTETQGLIEDAVAGVYEQDDRHFEIFDFEEQPVDFVPLVVANEDNEPETVSMTVRASYGTNLNANRGSHNFGLYSVDEAWNGDATVETDEGEEVFDLAEELATLADRPVEYEEVRTAMDDAGAAALAIRNLSAFRAERE